MITTMQIIQSQCACGEVRVAVPYQRLESSEGAPKVVDCHCAGCRKFHVAAFTSYLILPGGNTGGISSIDSHDDDCDALVVRGRESLSIYRGDSCDELGTVDRYFCGKCYAKLFSRPSRGSFLLLNLGPVLDDSVPTNMLESWRNNRVEWQLPAKAFWTDCRPVSGGRRGYPSLSQGPLIVHGSCACKSCQYQIDWSRRSTEVQHCYCRLCRRLSGGPFQSWIFLHKHNLQWKLLMDPATGECTSLSGTQLPPHDSPLQLQRTTSHGQRHCCRRCGSVLTIVYDSQHDYIWPAAGGLDDIDDPELIWQWENQVRRVLHISCRYKQNWYALPNDGLPRVQEAS